jgi:hypothetical protein
VLNLISVATKLLIFLGPQSRAVTGEEVAAYVRNGTPVVLFLDYYFTIELQLTALHNSLTVESESLKEFFIYLVKFVICDD